MIEKPKHGEPCNNCGQCCEDMLCPIAQYLCGYSFGRCPMLERNGEESACGLVVNPAKYVPNICIEKTRKAVSEAASVLIGSGFGCDACLETEEQNMAFSGKLSRLRDEMQRDGTIPRAAAVFGIPQA